MSTDWDRYSAPVATRARARTPADNGVVSLPVRGVRATQLAVLHEPIPENRAHAGVRGEKTAEVRLLLARVMRWEIRVGPQLRP